LDFWAEMHGFAKGDKQGLKSALAALVRGVKLGTEVARKVMERKPEPVGNTLVGRKKPWMPKMRYLREEELVGLARLRKLPVEGMRAAVADRRLAFCQWPYDRDRPDGVGPMSQPSWVVTDPERWVAQFRRLDGKCYAGREGNEVKSWSTKNTCWPIGAGQVGERGRIMVCEGGADMLAAYALRAAAGLEEEVAIWGVFGASVRICEEALAAARGRRVRIFADNDAPQERLYKHRGAVTVRPGWEAAAKWEGQFSGAGAARVDVYDLEPMGPEVGDLNDLVSLGIEGVDLEHLFEF